MCLSEGMFWLEGSMVLDYLQLPTNMTCLFVIFRTVDLLAPLKGTAGSLIFPSSKPHTLCVGGSGDAIVMPVTLPTKKHCYTPS